MISREYMIWLAGIGLSLILHASLFIQSSVRPGVENASEAKVPLITRLNFYQQPAIKTESILKSTPIIEDNPLVAKSKNKQKIKKSKVVKVDQQLVQLTPQSQGQLSNNRPAWLISKKKAYIQLLLAHIENQKFYPRSARSRGIEGDVQVSFELMADGGIRALQVAGGRSVLRRATQQAVKNAIPLPLPPVELGVPRKIEFTIQYLLQ